MDGRWFGVLVSQRYNFNRDIQQATEEEIREAGFEWQNVERSFIWSNLEPDFIRELVEFDQIYKTTLEHHLIAALQGFATYPSTFYQNMYIYLKLNLAEQKQLKNYSDRVGEMYMNQLQQEQESRQIYSLVDGTGRILDQIFC